MATCMLVQGESLRQSPVHAQGPHGAQSDDEALISMIAEAAYDAALCEMIEAVAHDLAEPANQALAIEMTGWLMEERARFALCSLQ